MEEKVNNKIIFYNDDYKYGTGCSFGFGVRIGDPKYNNAHISIGNNCVFEDGVVIIGQNIVIDDNVHIGKNCFIKGENIKIGNNTLIFDQVLIAVTKQLVLGTRNKISRDCAFRCYSIRIGNDLWCNENVDIGGGGCWQNSALLEIGDFVHIGKSAMINVCQPTYIGSRTGIGIESMIFTHSAGNGQSILEGYTHTEKSVWIGEHVSLYTRAFIAPGSTLDSGVIVGASAYASGHLEKGLYVGIPAKKKREIPKLSNEERISIMKKVLIQSFDGKVSLYHGKELLNSTYSEGILLLTEENNKTNQELIDELFTNHKNIIVLSMCPFNVDTYKVKKYTLFRLIENDILGVTSVLSENVRDMLRRNGILPNYSYYSPFQLDYNKLKMKGIEK